MFFQGFQPLPGALGVERCLRLAGLENGGERELSYADCLGFARPDQVPDVGDFIRGRRGRALRLRALFDELRPSPKARYVVLSTADGSDDPVALPLREVRELGLLVYGRDGEPLSYWHGGPFHLILPGFPYASSDLPHLVSVEFAEASTAEARPRPIRSDSAGVPSDSAAPADRVGFSSPGRFGALPAL